MTHTAPKEIKKKIIDHKTLMDFILIRKKITQIDENTTLCKFETIDYLLPSQDERQIIGSEITIALTKYTSNIKIPRIVEGELLSLVNNFKENEKFTISRY